MRPGLGDRAARARCLRCNAGLVIRMRCRCICCHKPATLKRALLGAACSMSAYHQIATVGKPKPSQPLNVLIAAEQARASDQAN